MSFGAPKPPDARNTADIQQGYNINAANKQQQLNMLNQSTPFGSLNWMPDANAPGGYSENVTLAPEQQALLEQQNRNKAIIAGLTGGFAGTADTLAGNAGTLAENTAGMYSAAPNLDPSAITNKLLDWQTKYVQPIFNQQSSNLEAQLRNQGLAPGSEAYNNAKNLLARNQGDVTNQFFAQDEPLAFSQEVQKYQLPAQTISALLGAGGSAAGTAGAVTGAGGPQGPAFQQTPTEQIQPANYQGLAEQNYQQQNQNYENTLAGLFGIPTAVAGGWARGGFKLPG